MKMISILFTICAVIILATGLIYSEVFFGPLKRSQVQEPRTIAPVSDNAMNSGDGFRESRDLF